MTAIKSEGNTDWPFDKPLNKDSLVEEISRHEGGIKETKEFSAFKKGGWVSDPNSKVDSSIYRFKETQFAQKMINSIKETFHFSKKSILRIDQDEKGYYLVVGNDEFEKAVSRSSLCCSIKTALVRVFPEKSGLLTQEDIKLVQTLKNKFPELALDYNHKFKISLTEDGNYLVEKFDLGNNLVMKKEITEDRMKELQKVMIPWQKDKIDGLPTFLDIEIALDGEEKFDKTFSDLEKTPQFCAKVAYFGQKFAKGNAELALKKSIKLYMEHERIKKISDLPEHQKKAIVFDLVKKAMIYKPDNPRELQKSLENAFTELKRIEESRTGPTLFSWKPEGR